MRFNVKMLVGAPLLASVMAVSLDDEMPTLNELRAALAEASPEPAEAFDYDGK